MIIMFVSGSLIGGGAERVLTQLANTFSQKGHQVSIVQFIGGDSYPLEESIRVVNYEKSDSSMRRSGFRKISFLRRTIKQVQPDVVISFMTTANVLTLIASIGLKSKAIVSERNDPHRVPQKKSMRVLRKLVYPLSDGFVFQTTDARDFFSQRIRNKSVVIKNPLSSGLPEKYTGEREKKIVMAGRLVDAKNYPLAIRSFSIVHKRFPDYSLEIYGEGNKYGELVRIVNEEGLADCVHFNGFVSDWHERARKASIFLLSSDYEGMSNSLIEAMAMGIPCVSTDHPIGGAKELISHGDNGLLVPVGDKLKMADAICSLLSNESLLNHISESAVRIREEIQSDTIANQWLKLCGDLAGS